MRSDLKTAVRAIQDAEVRRAFEFVTESDSGLSSLKREIEDLKKLLDSLRSSVGGGFEPIDGMSTVLTVSGTNGDGTYDAGNAIDFSSYVPSGAKKAYVQIIISATGIISTTQPWGFRYKPTGYTDYIEHYQDSVRDNAIDEKFTCVFGLASDMAGTLYCFKPDNGAGDPWSYTVKVWGYE